MMERLWERFDRIVVFDTETTGIGFGKDRIIELGAVSLENGEEVDSRTYWSACRRARPCRPLSRT